MSMTSHPPLDLSPEQIRGMQLKSLQMFNYLKAFCDEQGLLVYFCGGCCIGALRHKGFIPWDDDVDVFMPREDYERLTVLWSQYADTDRYTFVRSTRDEVSGDLMAKICDNTTTCITTYQVNKDIPQGLSLDILPLDGYPDGAFARRVQVFWALIFSLFCAQSVPTNHGGVLAVGSRFLLGLIRSPETRYRIWRYAEKKMSRHAIADCTAITELCSGPGYMRNRYPASAFASAVCKEFEGGLVPLPIGYDRYLSIAFGDYMKLPPEDKRKPHHEVAFLDLDKGYEFYKGIRYCVDRP